MWVVDLSPNMLNAFACVPLSRLLALALCNCTAQQIYSDESSEDATPLDGRIAIGGWKCIAEIDPRALLFSDLPTRSGARI
ncbi:predicted protein [Pyrenophora tritici-repentis Pt-1C-BFP]|uniref:Secreted protein n=1 Tax=Pyrenophora tritici-repentis (strain Pt-1C-BFP) TaxID=426418 RepID=B2W379_PYRTR|nr:uncharacterized protein PTRG_03877 [Pyrenophora tritici-repentis Pt-1C-BFP]EDU46715.1 predicted protein [Pyrenophora tritici-repentis Pt-1C-BFP]